MRALCGALMGLFLFSMTVSALATPSSTYWTICSIDIQAAGVTHLGFDNFFGFGSNNPDNEFPADIGPQWGAQLTPKLAAEYGLDIMSSPVTTPFFVNAKIGFRENTISRNAPAIQLAFFGFGTKRGDLDNRQNIMCLIIGKSLPDKKTRISAAYYVGKFTALRSSSGETQNTGYMVAMDHQIVPGKWVLAADYASGENVIGGGGVGVYYYFTKDISILTGPVWFNDTGINGSAKMTVQINFNI